MTQKITISIEKAKNPLLEFLRDQADVDTHCTALDQCFGTESYQSIEDPNKLVITASEGYCNEFRVEGLVNEKE